jgi:thiol-disulfide isomerase/thioredoxin
MAQAIQLGPIVLPLQLLLLFFTIVVAMWIGGRTGRKTGTDVESLIIQTIVVAIVAARLAYVWQFRGAYLQTPLDVFDVRDGGWSAEGGMVVAWLFALSRVRDRSAKRKPVLMAMSVASAVWLAGTLLLLLAPAPQATLPTQPLAALDESSVALSAFAGRPTVVNFWATWCPPCQREMPVLQRAQSENPELNFVFLNQGEAPEQVRQYLQRRRLDLRNVVLDPKGSMGMYFNQTALPTTLFFDAHGRLISTRVGELSAASLQQRLIGASTAHPEK